MITPKVNQYQGKTGPQEPEFNPDRVRQAFKQEAIKRAIKRQKQDPCMLSRFPQRASDEIGWAVEPFAPASEAMHKHRTMCDSNKWQESYIRDTGFNPLTKFISSG